MSEEMLEIVVRRYFAMPMDKYVFNWQGGEPTLMGIEFFRKALQLQQRYRPKGCEVVNILQTNGTLLDTKWCTFLKRNKFIVGISLDGPVGFHDIHRRDRAGKGTCRTVLKAVQLLKNADIPFSTLTLVTSDLADKGVDVYDFLRGQGITHQHFIECVERKPDGTPCGCSLRPGQWANFLLDIFKRWIELGDVGVVSIRLFDSIMSLLTKGVPQLCSQTCNCRQYFVVEHNGDLFPCDFHVLPELKLGNIMENSFSDFIDCEAYCSFGERKTTGKSDACLMCRFYALCGGDCQKNRDSEGKSLLCEDWQKFYSMSIPFFESCLS